MRRVMVARRGQAVVEFALVLPLVLIMVISVFEFARAWNIQQVLTDAAREGARLAVVGSGNDEAAGVTEAKVKSAINNATAVAAITLCGTCIDVTGLGTGRGFPATVSIEHEHRFFFLGPMMGWTIGKSTLTLGTSITMRNE
jgi:Flp pilus assembly protein TadG